MGNKNLLTFAVVVMGSRAYQGTVGKGKPAESSASAPTAHRPGASSSGTAAEKLPGEEKLRPYPRSLVVTVPDPVRTHLALKFDTAMDGIIGAAQSRGYILETYFVPWRI